MPGRCIFSKSNFDNWKRQRARHQLLSSKSSIHLRAWWSVLTTNWFFSEGGQSFKTVYSVARHSLCVVSCSSCVLHGAGTLTISLWASALQILALIAGDDPIGHPKRLDLPYTVQLMFMVSKLAPTKASFLAGRLPAVPNRYSQTVGALRLLAAYSEAQCSWQTLARSVCRHCGDPRKISFGTLLLAFKALKHLLWFFVLLTIWQGH